MADKRISQLVDRGTVANNDVVPIVVSGAVTTNKATISSIQTFMQGNLDFGVTSVGITLGSSGTDVSVTGSPITTSGNITINIPTASATNRGLLSSTDWITFNAKQPAGNYVTLDTVQTITAQKTITTNSGSDTFIVNHTSGNGIGVNITKGGNNEALRVAKTSGSGNAVTITGGLLSAEAATLSGNLIGTSASFSSVVSITATGGGAAINLRGRTADDLSNILFFNNSGITLQNIIQSSPSSLSINSQGNTPITFGTNIAGGGGVRMTIAGTGGVTFTNGITTTSAVLTSVLQGVNANFTSLIETAESVRVGTVLSIKHNSTVFTLNGFNNIQGNINSFVVTNESKNLRLNFPSVGGLTHTLPDASGVLALTSNIPANIITGNGIIDRVAKFTAVGTIAVSNINDTTTEVNILNRLAVTVSGNQFILTPGLGGTANRIETVGALPLQIVSTGPSLTLAAGGATPQFTLTSAGAVTLTGALNGTSATFSGNVTIRPTSGFNAFFQTSGTALRINYLNDALSANISATYRATDFGWQDGSGGNILTLASTGAATFSSSVTAATGIFSISAGNPLQAYQTSATNGTTAIIRQTGGGGNGNNDIGLVVDIQGAADNDRIANFRYFDGTNFNSRVSIMRGGGITFNGDTAAANALDDYEEGAWTPVPTSSGASFNAAVNGTYTKIGRLVYITGQIDNFTAPTGTLTNEMSITGLPFTSTSTNGYGASLAVGFEVHIDYPSGGLNIQARIPANTSRIDLRFTIDDTPGIDFLASNFDNGDARIAFAGSYEV